MTIVVTIVVTPGKPTVDAVLDPVNGLHCPLLVTAWAQPEALGTRQMLLETANSELLRGPRARGALTANTKGSVGVGSGGGAVCDVRSNPFASLLPQTVTDDHGTCNYNNRYMIAVAPAGWVGWGQ